MEFIIVGSDVEEASDAVAAIGKVGRGAYDNTVKSIKGRIDDAEREREDIASHLLNNPGSFLEFQDHFEFSNGPGLDANQTTEGHRLSISTDKLVRTLMNPNSDGDGIEALAISNANSYPSQVLTLVTMGTQGNSSNDLPLGGSGLEYVRQLDLTGYEATDRNIAFGFRAIGLADGNLLSYTDSGGAVTPLLTLTLLGTQINAVNSVGTVIPIGPVLTREEIFQITGIIRPADGTTDRFASDPMHMWISINGGTPIITEIVQDSNVIPSSSTITFGRNDSQSRVGALQFAIFNPPVPASASGLLTAHAIDNLNTSYERNMFTYIAAGGADREFLNIVNLEGILIGGVSLTQFINDVVDARP